MKKYFPVYVLIAMVLLPFLKNPYSFTMEYFVDDYLAHLLDYNYPEKPHFSDTILVEKNWQIDNITREYHFGRHYTWWKTPERNVSPESVLENYKAGHFRKWRPSRFGQWYNNSDYWYCFILRNENDSEERMLLSIENNRHKTFLYRNSGEHLILVDSNSSHLPVEYRTNFSQNQIFYFDVAPHSSETYLFKVQKTIRANTIFSLGVNHTAYIPVKQHRIGYYHFAFIGFFGFMMVLMMVMAFALREKIYIYQSLYIGVITLFICSAFGIDALMMPTWLYVPYSYLEPIIFPLAGAFFFILIYHGIINLRKISPESIRLVRGTQYFNVLALIASLLSSGLYFFIPEQYYLKVNTWLQIPVLLFFLTFFIGYIVLTIKVYNKVLPKNRVYLLIVIVVLILWLIQIMNYVGISNFHLVFHNNLLVGLSVETALFTYIMVKRFIDTRKEHVELLQTKLALQNELLTSVIDAQESERKRIAQELHDGLGGYLSALRMMVNRKKNSFDEKNHPESADAFIEVQDKLDKAIKDVREISHNLMPSELDSGNFSNLLKEHLEYLNENGTLVFEYYIDEKINACDKVILISLYRITFELIRNIQKHSEATKATVQLIMHQDVVQLQVEDNGKGMDEHKGNGIGLNNIRSRIQYLNGTMNIDSGKLGTTFIIEIPLSVNT